MKYVYNEELDRLNQITENVHFFLVTYETETKDIRTLYLYALTGNEKHWMCIAEKFKNTNESVQCLYEVWEEEYLEWFLHGKTEIILNNDTLKIPGIYVLKYAISMDIPQFGHEIGGNLMTLRKLIDEQDVNILKSLEESWLCAQKEIIRYV